MTRAWFKFVMLNYRRYRSSSSVQPLQEVAAESIVSQLGQVAEGINSRFTCSGKYEVPSNKPIKLVYRQAGLVSTEEWSSVEFPGVSEADMIKLLDVCSVASYGYEGKDVVDKNYRNAFKMEPDSFTTSFQICSTPILQGIQSIVPTVVGLRAELYKLNIYARGGFFKAHVDTPRSEKMFGSLVVCLPTQFTGGELIVRHHKEEIKYDWSSAASDTSSTLHWAAFFSDVEHEVLPVSEGYRVTLTYNLSYQSKTSESTIDIKTYNFYKLLQATLSNPVFMRDGGVLGFNSHYSYVFDMQWADLLTPINTIEDKAKIIKQLDKKLSCDKFIHLSKDEQLKVFRDAGIIDIDYKQILDALPLDFPLLKGADYIVVESAKSLGLPVCVKPFLNSNSRLDESNEYALKDFSQQFVAKEGLEMIDRDESSIHELSHLQLFSDATCRYKSQDITWCQRLLYCQPAGASMVYGNEPILEAWYKSAAILIRIPKWSEYRQKLIAISTGESCGIHKASETDEDGSVKDFKDVIHDYEDIVQEETQQLLGQVKELLDVECINEVKELKDKLVSMRKFLKLNGLVKSPSKQVDVVCGIKCDLHLLKCYVESPFIEPPDKINALHHAVHELKSNRFLSLFYEEGLFDLLH